MSGYERNRKRGVSDYTNSRIRSASVNLTRMTYTKKKYAKSQGPCSTHGPKSLDRKSNPILKSMCGGYNDKCTTDASTNKHYDNNFSYKTNLKISSSSLDNVRVLGVNCRSNGYSAGLQVKIGVSLSQKDVTQK